eukprot:3320873-Rhodomonas_salina.2
MATRCPVLTNIGYAVSGTDLGYTGYVSASFLEEDLGPGVEKAGQVRNQMQFAAISIRFVLRCSRFSINFAVA